MGPIPETGMAAIQGMAAAPAGLYFWTAFERLSAVGLHTALSVLVYTAVRKRIDFHGQSPFLNPLYTFHKGEGQAFFCFSSKGRSPGGHHQKEHPLL